MSVFAPITWLGRVILWFVLLPVGIWRSFRHGRQKSEKRVVAEVNRQLQQQARPRYTIPGIYTGGALPPPPKD